MPNQTSSTAQDLARGKPSEIDFLNGYIVRKGAELSIPTPTNHALQVMVKLAERSRELSHRAYSGLAHRNPPCLPRKQAPPVSPGEVAGYAIANPPNTLYRCRCAR
jgi:Ketopantoate reductase PanE/ApbA C terminal